MEGAGHSTESDESVAKRALSQRDAFGILMNRYEAKLSRYLYRLGISSPEDREDVLQDAFLKTYQNLAGFNSNLSFSSWMYRITHNEAMTFFRRRAVRPEGHQVLDGESALAGVSFDETLTDELDAALDGKRLLQAVEALPTKFRTVIVLFYFEHKSYAEISDILRLPLGSVATLISRAKVHLKKGLDTT